MLYFKMSFYYLKPEIQQIYQIKYSNFLSDTKIYPASLFTTFFIKQELQKNSFFLLFVEDNVSKLIQIKD